MSSKELHASRVPAGYTPNVFEFIVPLVLLIAIAVGTFVATGAPQVNWAFAAALFSSIFIAMFKGMALGDIIDGDIFTNAGDILFDRHASLGVDRSACVRCRWSRLC